VPALASDPRASLAPEVVERFRRGEEEGFVAVYDAFAPLLRPIVAHFFSSPFEREEATQEVWLHAHRMAGAFDPARGGLGPWLRALCANRCREILRARGRRPNPSEPLAEDALVDGETPETRARDERLRAAVAAFAGALDGEEAAVWRLSLVEDRPHEEVAAAVGISVRRCKYLRGKLLKRAAAEPRLRAVLEEGGER
jgi:RNA polymerase sigma-70 factor (ECF subfamily)